MYTPDLEALFLTDEELTIAKNEVEQIAFCKWKEAGSPAGRDRDFWQEAQLEWIEYRYVPDRYAPPEKLCELRGDR